MSWSFDATQHQPATVGAGQLPVSDKNGHLVVITEAEMKAAKSGNGQNGFLELTLEVIDGAAKGSTGAYRLNLFHDNPQTVDIANRQLSAVCHVTGVYRVDVASLPAFYNLPFRAVVGMQKKQKADDPDYTEVKGVLHADGSQPGKGTPANQGGNAPGASAPGPGFAVQGGVPMPASAPASATAAPANGQPAWGGGQPAPAANQAPPANQAPATGQPAWGQNPAPANNAPAWAR